MKVQVTRKFQIIDPNKHKADAINLTMRRYRKCVNFYLHNVARDVPVAGLYEDAKRLYGLQTGLVQTARDFAVEQYKSYKNNPDNNTFPHANGLSTVRYDRRSISFHESDSGMFRAWANISTVNGRVRVPIRSAGAYTDGTVQPTVQGRTTDVS
jgi:hypothetical protein